jgi:hypothetical protein
MFEGRLLHTWGEDLLAVVGCIERRGGESISDINNLVLRQYDGGPAPVANGRDTALADRLRFFEDRRFTVVSKKGEVTFLSLLCGHSCARTDLRPGFAHHCFLICVFANASRHGTIGQPYEPKDSQPDGGKFLSTHKYILLCSEVKSNRLGRCPGGENGSDQPTKSGLRRVRGLTDRALISL